MRHNSGSAHFGMQIWEDLGIELPTFRLEDDHSIPSATATHYIDALYECVCVTVCDWVNVKLYCKALWVVIKTRKALYKY